MAFWDFLHDANSETRAVKNTSKKVFKFLGGSGDKTVRQQLHEQAKAQPKNQVIQQADRAPVNTFNPAKTALDFGVAVARGFPRGGATIGKSIGDVVNNVTGAPDVGAYDPNNNGLARLLLGSEPIKSIGQRQAGAEEAVKGNEQFKGVAAPLSFLGVVGSVAGDVLPGGKIGKKGAEELAKTSNIDKVRKLLKDIVPQDKLETTAQAVAATPDPHVVTNIVHNASNAEPPHIQGFIKQYGDSLQQMESGFKGGQMIPTPDGGYKRISEHSPFYRQVYESTGRPPTKADWHAEAHRQLINGKADSYAQAEFDKLKDPEVASLLNQPESYGAPDTSVGQSLPAPKPQVLTEETGPMREKQFKKSVRESEHTSPEAKKELAKDTKYQQKTNPELSAKTQKFVEENPDEAMRRATGESSQSTLDEDVAIGQHLMRQAVKNKDAPAEVHLAEALDKKLREHGRAVQAASMLDRLSPEGVLLKAQRGIRKAREEHKAFGQEKSTAKEIETTLATAKREKPEKVIESIKKTVDDVLNDVPAEELTTGGKLASKVEKAASPIKKKRTDMLVEELAKKVKQEHLDPKVISKKDPLKTLQEVFGRADEAKAAYPEAQAILRAKYADNEKMTAALDKFFGSKLGDIPAASSTIDAAIKGQLAAKKVQVSKAIYRSWEGQAHTIADVTKALVKEGFDEKSAAILAKEVMGRLNKSFSESKIKALEKMAKKVPEKQRQTYIEKVSKLSNVGALDSQDYIDLARGKLGLPNLSQQTAKELSAMAQKIQDLPEGAEKYKAVRQIKQLIEENTPLTTEQKLGQAVGTPRALMASGDLSFGGRQAIAYAAAHPVKFAKAWKKQFAYFKEGFQKDESQAFDNLMGEIQSHKDYDLLEKSSLAITDPFGISPSAREEQFIGSSFAEKIPGLGRLVRASNYAFTGLANNIRASEFYDKVGEARKAGFDLDEKLLNDVAEVINVGTGRGNIKKLEKHMNSLSTALFAPRLIISRVKTFSNAFDPTLHPFARKEAQRQLAALGTFAFGLLGIAAAAGAEVGTDPTSSDFGKIKIGDTRLDFFGGYTQYLRLAAQLQQGRTTSSLSGRESQLGSGYGQKSRYDIITKFLESKENPVVSFATTMIKGEDPVGNEVSLTNPKDIASQVVQRMTPLVFQDVKDTTNHKGLNPLIAAPLATVGVGVQTYGKQDIKLTPKQQEYVDMLTKKGASKKEIEANKDFYQSLKTTPDRDAASKKINDALASGDTQKAVKIAQKYNEAYAAAFKEWPDKYGQYQSAQLLKDYQSGKINLTTSNIQTRIKNLRKATLGAQ